MGDIYIILNDIYPEMKYIGKALNGAATRQSGNDSSHVTKALLKKDNSLLHNHMRYYGIQHFHYEILETNIPENKLNEREKFQIKEMNTKYPNGYNMTDGGDGGNTQQFNTHKNESIDKQRKTYFQNNYIELSKENLYKDIFINSLTCKELKEKYHTTNITLNNRLKEYFGKTLKEIRKENPIFNSGQFIKKEIDEEELYKDVIENKMTVIELSKKYKVSEDTLTARVKKIFNGLTVSQVRKNMYPKKEKQKLSYEEYCQIRKNCALKGSKNPAYKEINIDLLNQMIIKEKSLNEITKALGVSSPTLYNRIKEHFNMGMKEYRKYVKSKN